MCERDAVEELTIKVIPEETKQPMPPVINRKSAQRSADLTMLSAAYPYLTKTYSRVPVFNPQCRVATGYHLRIVVDGMCDTYAIRSKNKKRDCEDETEGNAYQLLIVSTTRCKFQTVKSLTLSW